MEVVIDKCGEPLNIKVVGSEKYGKSNSVHISKKGAAINNGKSTSSFKSKAVYVEEATFCIKVSYSNNCYIHVLTFKGGSLDKIKNTFEKSKIKN